MNTEDVWEEIVVYLVMGDAAVNHKYLTPVYTDN